MTPRFAGWVPVLAALALWGTATAQQPAATLLDTAVLSAPRLGEASGIVQSHRNAGLFWTINDSGSEPLLFALDSAGTDRGRFTVGGAQNVDWEDISLGPCTRSAGTCLYIADTGDNRFQRPVTTVYVVPEPEAPSGPSDTARVVTVQETIQLRFPDGPHDAEGLAIYRDYLLLVTKDRIGPVNLFRAPLRGTGVRVLEKVATLPMRTGALNGRLATGAAVSRDGRTLVVRTYVSLHLFSLDGWQVAALTTPDGLTIPVIETQGEGICFDDLGRLVLVSERGSRGHGILSRLRLARLPSS